MPNNIHTYILMSSIIPIRDVWFPKSVYSMNKIENLLENENAA